MLHQLILLSNVFLTCFTLNMSSTTKNYFERKKRFFSNKSSDDDKKKNAKDSSFLRCSYLITKTPE